MITMMIKIKLMPGKKKEFLDTMRSLQNDKRNQKGIRRSKVYEDVEDSNGFNLVDDWETDEDLERYRNGENFRVFLGALKTLCTETNVTCGPFWGVEDNRDQERKKSEIEIH